MILNITNKNINRIDSKLKKVISLFIVLFIIVQKSYAASSLSTNIPSTQNIVPAQKSTKTILKKQIPSTEKKWYFNSFTEFAGPSAEFSLPFESYSPYNDSFSPMQFYQSLNLKYSFDMNNRVGTEWTGVKPIQSDVPNQFGGNYSTDFTLYDPILFYEFNQFIHKKDFWINGKMSLSAPITSFSKEFKKITDLYLGYYLKIRCPNPSWYLGFDFESTFHLWQNATGFNLFDGSIGHNLGYYFSPQWSIDSASIFDYSYASDFNNQTKLTSGSVDRLKLTLRYQPVINVIQLGLFFQSPIYDRRPERMALGANLNLWF